MKLSRRIALTHIFAFAGTLVAAPSAFATEPGPYIVVSVNYKIKNNIATYDGANANIVLYKVVNNRLIQLKTATANSFGQYTWSRLETGTYRVKVKLKVNGITQEKWWSKDLGDRQEDWRNILISTPYDTRRPTVNFLF